MFEAAVALVLSVTKTRLVSEQQLKFLWITVSIVLKQITGIRKGKVYLTDTFKIPDIIHQLNHINNSFLLVPESELKMG